MAGLASKTYGHALFSLGEETGTTGRLLEDAKTVLAVFGETPELMRFYCHPKISPEEKKQLTEQSFLGKVSDEMTGFLLLMIENDRQAEMEASLQSFVAEVKEAAGIGQVVVSVPMALTEAQKAEIERKILATTGYRSLEVEYRLQPELLGGLVIRINDRVMDASIRTQLFEMSKELHKLQLS